MRIGVGLDTVVQARLRRFQALGLDIADGQHAFGPEVVGVLSQGDLEILDRIGKPWRLYSCCRSGNNRKRSRGGYARPRQARRASPARSFFRARHGRSPEVVCA